MVQRRTSQTLGAILNSDRQPVSAEPFTSSPLLVSGFSDMFRYHQLLGKNCVLVFWVCLGCVLVFWTPWKCCVVLY